MLQESQEKGPEYKNNSYIHHQPLPKQIPEEQDVHTDYNDYQQHNEDRYNI
jgi:hypothetical protein